jgi:hypothetical protein
MKRVTFTAIVALVLASSGAALAAETDTAVNTVTDRVIDRPTDRVIDRPTDRVIDRPTDRVIDRPTDRVTDQRPRTDRPRDRVTDRHPRLVFLQRCLDHHLGDRPIPDDISKRKLHQLWHRCMWHHLHHNVPM